MKIYAIRDRLLDYYMQPFAGPEDKAVLASIATMINRQGENSDIAQAPHHFEVWELGQVDHEGHINPTRKLIADCASLIRPGVRQRAHAEGPTAAQAAQPMHGHPSGDGRPGRANGGPVQSPPPAAEVPAPEVRRGPQGGYPPRGDA